MNFIYAVLLSMILAAGGCASPESSRSRGGGPGADVGNRKQIVQMHEGSLPFENTPRLIPAKHPPLDSARHADLLSRQ